MRRSLVSGARVRAVPPKTVSPIRSAGRRETKSRATRLATSSRFFGWKSSAPMLPEMSSAIWMSIPSVVASSQAYPSCGRASARTRAQKASRRA